MWGLRSKINEKEKCVQRSWTKRMFVNIFVGAIFVNLKTCNLQQKYA